MFIVNNSDTEMYEIKALKSPNSPTTTINIILYIIFCLKYKVLITY